MENSSTFLPTLKTHLKIGSLFQKVTMRKEPPMDLLIEAAKQKEERNVSKRQMNTHSLRETI